MIAKRIRKRIRGERGIALIVVALGLTAFIGVSALALDMGMLYTARTESQRVADGAALAGASQFIENPNAVDLDARVRAEAVDYASRNNVRGSPVALDPTADIDVFLEDDSVRVTVRHTTTRGNAIPTLFARVFGTLEADVVTIATAYASHGHDDLSVNCPLPISVSAEWWNEGDPGYDPDEGDCYGADNPSCPQPFDYGWGDEDVGQMFMMKPSQGGTSPGSGNEDGAWFEPSDWYVWLPDGSHGAKAAAEYILDCPGGPEWEITVGDTLEDKPGVSQGPIVAAFEELISRDAGAFWEDTDPSASPSGDCIDGWSCIQNSKCGESGGATGYGTCVSERIKTIPVFDPNSKTGSSDKDFTVDQFAYVWIDHVSEDVNGQKNVYARWIGGAGSGGGETGETSEIVKVLRLTR